MLGALGGGNMNRDQNFQTCWSQLPIGFKFYFLGSLIFAVLGMVFGSLTFFMANIVIYTVESFQIWRLITSIFAYTGGPFALLNVLICFYWLYSMLPQIERKLSTAYMVMEIMIQTLTMNLFLVVIGYIMITIGLGSAASFIGMGIIPIIISFAFKQSAKDPEGLSRFCCFPCLIPKKYIPWLFVVILAIFSSPLTMIIYGLAGHLQSLYYGKSFIRLPMSVYRKIDALMPKSILERGDYFKVSKLEANLRLQCGKSCFDRAPAQAQPNRNPYQMNQNQNQRNIQEAIDDKVEVIGGGVKIGAAQQHSNFRNHWSKYNEADLADHQRVQIQQKGPQSPNAKIIKQEQTNSNESYVSNKPLISDNDLLQNFQNDTQGDMSREGSPAAIKIGTASQTSNFNNYWANYEQNQQKKKKQQQSMI